MIAHAPQSLAPMEAKVVGEIPTGDHWLYESKWDGFRCLAFRDGDHIEMQSKAERSLTRYFPEMVEVLGDLKPRRFILDGELVVPVRGTLSFDALLLRIHPAESRIRQLSRQTPAVYIVFDLLQDERGRSLLGKPLGVRREALEAFAEKHLKNNKKIVLSPATRDIKAARKWFASSGTDRDGVIAKRADLPYMSGERTGMVKIKKRRTADCVIGGFRYATGSRIVGSLLLGLFDENGVLNHVGFTSSLSQKEREALTPKLERLRKPPEKGGGFSGHAPGGSSRWSTERSTEWVAVNPKLVVEVEFDHVTGNRFRHGTKFVRWRPDKSPRQCTYDQVRSVGRRHGSLPI
jgi:ATP-dependent DNA ligase